MKARGTGRSGRSQKVVFMVACTVPGTKIGSAEKAASLRQDRLDPRHDLALTLKHVRRNSNGPQFIAVRALLDPQAGAAREMAGAAAERPPAPGAPQPGPPGALAARRSWDACSTAAAAGAGTGAVGSCWQRRAAG
jgi:starvation-inducible DNA-binding protein